MSRRRYVRIARGSGPGQLAERGEFAEQTDDGFFLLDGPPYQSTASQSTASRSTASRTGERVSTSEARLLAPVIPSKIVCIGRNYRAHAEELGNAVPTEPLMFFKPPSALLRHAGVVRLPAQSTRVEHEVELGIVIGKRATAVTANQAMEHVFGYTVVCDITARDLQRGDKTWARGKGFDTFCPTGPCIVTGIDVSALNVRCTVNDEVRQDGNTSQMIFSPADVIAYISHVMTLEPGDLIATGTPAGVGPLLAGDRVSMTIDDIGELAFSVAGS